MIIVLIMGSAFVSLLSYSITEEFGSNYISLMNNHVENLFERLTCIFDGFLVRDSIVSYKRL